MKYHIVNITPITLLNRFQRVEVRRELAWDAAGADAPVLAPDTVGVAELAPLDAESSLGSSS